MRRRTQIRDPSSDETDSAATETDNDCNDDTEPTDIDSDRDEDAKDLAVLSEPEDENSGNSREHYFRQLRKFNESELAEQDYVLGSALLLDRIEEQWHQSWIYLGKDPVQTYWAISARVLRAFFNWLLKQCRGKGGRKKRGTKVESSLGTYWKLFRLVFERATGGKINSKLNRQMHKLVGSAWMGFAANTSSSWDAHIYKAHKAERIS